MSRRDRAIGIVLGLVIGVVALIIFVFAGSESSIDAPSLHQSTAAEQPAAGQK
jgi:uncharacterized membrane protein required for colicin V production